jgi:hypothetical protein
MEGRGSWRLAERLVIYGMGLDKGSRPTPVRRPCPEEHGEPADRSKKTEPTEKSRPKKDAPEKFPRRAAIIPPPPRLFADGFC